MIQTKTVFDISIWAIIKVLAVIFGVWFLITIKDILLLFYIVLVIVAALSPVVDQWSKRMNRVAAITLLYLVILAALTAIIVIVVPPLVSEVQNLSHNLPNYFSNRVDFLTNWRDQLGMAQGQGDLANQLLNVTSQIYNATVGVFGGLVALVTILVLSFYLLLEEHGAKKFLLQYLPIGEREKIAEIVQKIGFKLGAWMRGQLMLGLIIGLLNGIGLVILGVPYALTLAVWAGFTELIPYVGPVLGAIPAVFLAFTVSPVVGILTLVLYALVQQIEANFLVPKIMQKAVGLSPIIIILALLVGGKMLVIITKSRRNRMQLTWQ